MLAFRLLKQDRWKWKFNPSQDQLPSPADYYRQLVQSSTQNGALGKKGKWITTHQHWIISCSSHPTWPLNYTMGIKMYSLHLNFQTLLVCLLASLTSPRVSDSWIGFSLSHQTPAVWCFCWVCLPFCYVLPWCLYSLLVGCKLQKADALRSSVCCLPGIVIHQGSNAEHTNKPNLLGWNFQDD